MATPSRAVCERRVATALLAGAVVLLVSTAAGAQPAAPPAGGTTVGGSLALASLWDDETHLGRGAAAAAEVSMPLGAHVRAGVEGGWFPHTRDSGYLAASGDVLHLMGRADLLVAPRTWRTRPFIGAGVGLARSTGTLTLRTAAPGAAPAPTSRPWTHTRAAWNVRLGARITAGTRLAVRPEVSAGGIGSADTRGTLELPLLRLQAGVAVEWSLR